jgi:acetyltransferase-like isoleucine patch superfamily enzyme
MLFLKIFRENTLKQLIILVLEQWVQPFIAWIPGITGFTVRYLFFKLIFNHLGGFCYIGAGVTMQRSFGIRVGKRFAVNRGTILDGKGNLSIGDNVLIGPNVVITSAQHSFDRVDIPIIMQVETKKEVIIGNDVWIGANSVILPGVHIGDRVIIGAGSVVSHDIASHSIAVGAPARVIKPLL